MWNELVENGNERMSGEGVVWNYKKGDADIAVPSISE